MAVCLELARKKGIGKSLRGPWPLPLPSPFVLSAGCPRGGSSQHLEQKGREGEGEAASLCHRALQ